MLIGKVVGNVISTNKAECLTGLKLLMVQPVSLETLEITGDDPTIVVDCVDAGCGEIVMCVGGSSSRYTPESSKTPADYTALAVIDSIELRGKRVYEKYPAREEDA